MVETEELPGAVRFGKWKAVWNTRDGWRGAASYAAEVPALFDLWQDPQERFDIFMTNWTEKTWMAGPMGQKAMELLATYKKYPNRPVQTWRWGLRSSTPTTPSSRLSCRRSFTRWPGTSSRPPGGKRGGAGPRGPAPRKGT